MVEVDPVLLGNQAEQLRSPIESLQASSVADFQS